MRDRLLSTLLWATIIGLIMSTAMLALYLGYSGLYSLCAGRITSGSWAVAAGAGLCFASYVLARNGNDLMDR